MRTALLASLTAFSALAFGCDGGAANRPADRTPEHAAVKGPEKANGHCVPGRRLGFVFWGHGQGAEAQKTLTRLLHEHAPAAVVWEMHGLDLTVVVPDESAGEALIAEARRIGLKIHKEDYVAVGADCGLDWMNHGDTTPPNPNETTDTGAEGDLDGGIAASGDGGAPIPPPTKANPEAQACDAALTHDGGDYAKMVNHSTSVASTRMLLRWFAKSCAPTFPELAKAADEASKVNRTGRSRILAAASIAFCPSAPQSTLASSVVAACPPLEGDATLVVWKRLDAGTYAFAQTLKKAGIHSTLSDELILQASSHPELDK